MYVFVLLIAYLLILRFFMEDLSEKRAQKKYLILSAIPIILIMSLRYHIISVVSDTESYYQFYEMASSLSTVDLFGSSRFEPGYVLFNKAFASIIPNPQFVFFLEALICVSAVSRFIYKNSESPFLGMLFFVTLGTMTFEFTAFRQGIAMSICLFAVEYTKEKRFWLFFALVLIATTFHKTSIVFLPFYWIAHTKPTLRNILMILVFIAGVLFFAPNIVGIGNVLFDMNYGGYIGSDYGGLIPIIIYIITLIVMLIKKDKKDNFIFLNMVLVGLIIYVLRYTSLGAERISFYFTPAIVVALPDAIESFKGKKARIFLFFSSTSLAILLFFYRLTYMTLADYRFFWRGP